MLGALNVASEPNLPATIIAMADPWHSAQELLLADTWDDAVARRRPWLFENVVDIALASKQDLARWSERVVRAHAHGATFRNIKLRLTQFCESPIAALPPTTGKLDIASVHGVDNNNDADFEHFRVSNDATMDPFHMNTSIWPRDLRELGCVFALSPHQACILLSGLGAHRLSLLALRIYMSDFKKADNDELASLIGTMTSLETIRLELRRHYHSHHSPATFSLGSIITIPSVLGYLPLLHTLNLDLRITGRIRVITQLLARQYVRSVYDALAATLKHFSIRLECYALTQPILSSPPCLNCVEMSWLTQVYVLRNLKELAFECTTQGFHSTDFAPNAMQLRVDKLPSSLRKLRIRTIQVAYENGSDYQIPKVEWSGVSHWACVNLKSFIYSYVVAGPPSRYRGFDCTMLVTSLPHSVTELVIVPGFMRSAWVAYLPPQLKILHMAYCDEHNRTVLPLLGQLPRWLERVFFYNYTIDRLSLPQRSHELALLYDLRYLEDYCVTRVDDHGRVVLSERGVNGNDAYNYHTNLSLALRRHAAQTGGALSAPRFNTKLSLGLPALLAGAIIVAAFAIYLIEWI